MSNPASERSPGLQAGNARSTRTPHLVISVVGALVAIRADETLEIWQTERCHPVPAAPDYVLGVANWRGTPLPLVDLGRALGLRESPLRIDDVRSKRVVVVSVASMLVGLVVDGTDGVCDVESESSREPTIATSGRLGEFSLGEFDAPRGIAALVDAGAMLDALRVQG